MAVSSTPVREALTKLEAGGLVATRPDAGYVVAPGLDAAGLDHLFDVRGLLEPEAARLAAASQSQPADLRTTRAATTPHPGADGYRAYPDFAVLDARLHGVIADACGNPLIADALARQHAHTHGCRLCFRVGIAPATVAEHEAIVSALMPRRGVDAGSPGPVTGQAVSDKALVQVITRGRRPRSRGSRGGRPPGSIPSTATVT
ncbi:GntR family transcriptional regulator [Amycolatopsis sp. FDAARGOS 1241]|uniref:GntR family transcriptional regulator n=1 Tax=Amycolatopsis sp. FDAARGOS 1241 TaxID=2778070 RepID=UPI00194DE196|nr:GntR family transcriptional regulator [Amycolatopsis sp. FDAARGOS 1241]QRP49829.1 GntR family transcriptional regulator [Amycolatopsis sp. FDAARGOS 1241]